MPTADTSVKALRFKYRCVKCGVITGGNPEAKRIIWTFCKEHDPAAVQPGGTPQK